MMVVDELWEQSSKLSDNYSIEFYDNDIALVKNIFKYPELVLRFQKLLKLLSQYIKILTHIYTARGFFVKSICSNIATF